MLLSAGGCFPGGPRNREIGKCEIYYEKWPFMGGETSVNRQLVDFYGILEVLDYI